MTRIVLQSRVGADGVLHVEVPVGPSDANRDVRIIVEELLPTHGKGARTPGEWQDFIGRTAGAWQGELERPSQGEREASAPTSFRLRQSPWLGISSSSRTTPRSSLEFPA